MKRLALSLALTLLAGLLLAGCGKDQVLDAYGAAVAVLGNVGLDSSLTLQGDREFGEDKYTGTYTAEYEAFTGEECPFGGTALEKRENEHVTVTCTIECTAGTAKLVWNCGAAEPVALAEGAGTFTETVYLAPGSNYFNLEFEAFTGSVALEIR